MSGITRRDWLRGTASLSLGGVLWSMGASAVFRPRMPEADGPVPEWVLALVEARMAPWEGGDRSELDLARSQNPEWDLMSRLFLCFALGDLVLREPDQRERWLKVWDSVLTDTLERLEKRGQGHFLLGYASHGSFLDPSATSLFVAGELALMLGLRRLFSGSDAWTGEHRRWVGTIAARLEQSPHLWAESYPNECWTFCNSVAVAALRVADQVDGTDHSEFAARWSQQVQSKLLDEETGILIGSFTMEGQPIDRVEGSSIWMVTHQLRLIDPVFARDQYQRAKKELGRSLMGFGYAREWPESQEGRRDIDSGDLVPGLEASPSSSGLAVLAAASFQDERWLGQLLAALEFAAHPETVDGKLRFKASNLMGDSVLLSALTCGPLWRLAGAEEEA